MIRINNMETVTNTILSASLMLDLFINGKASQTPSNILEGMLAEAVSIKNNLGTETNN